MFRAWERHRLGAPVSGLLEDILLTLRQLEAEALNAAGNVSSTTNTGRYFCTFDVANVFLPLTKFISEEENSRVLINKHE